MYILYKIQSVDSNVCVFVVVSGSTSQSGLFPGQQWKLWMKYPPVCRVLSALFGERSSGHRVSESEAAGFKKHQTLMCSNDFFYLSLD